LLENNIKVTSAIILMSELALSATLEVLKFKKLARYTMKLKHYVVVHKIRRGSHARLEIM